MPTHMWSTLKITTKGYDVHVQVHTIGTIGRPSRTYAPIALWSNTGLKTVQKKFNQLKRMAYVAKIIDMKSDSILQIKNVESKLRGRRYVNFRMVLQF